MPEPSGEPKSPIGSLLTSTSNAATGLPQAFVASILVSCVNDRRWPISVELYEAHLVRADLSGNARTQFTDLIA